MLTVIEQREVYVADAEALDEAHPQVIAVLHAQRFIVAAQLLEIGPPNHRARPVGGLVKQRHAAEVMPAHDVEYAAVTVDKVEVGKYQAELGVAIEQSWNALPGSRILIGQRLTIYTARTN
jgi:hypothetical protein